MHAPEIPLPRRPPGHAASARHRLRTLGDHVVAWALGAVLWAASQLLGLLFSRVGIGEPNLRGSGVVAFGMMARGILLMIVALAVAVTDPTLAIAGALVYAAAYSLELGLSLTMYFSGEAKR